MTTTIEVRRRWLHWRPRWRRTGDIDPTSFIEFADEPGGILIGLLLGVVTVVALATIVPVIVIAFEVVLLVLLAMGGVAGRSLFRVPWTVEAIDTATGRVLATYRVDGFRRAGELARAVQQIVDDGGALPPVGAYDPDGPPPVPPRADDLLHDPTWPTG